MSRTSPGRKTRGLAALLPALALAWALAPQAGAAPSGGVRLSGAVPGPPPPAAHFPVPWIAARATAGPLRVAAARCSAASREEAVRCALAAHPGAEILSVSRAGGAFRVKLLTRDGVVRTITVPRR